ncbi:uncharacterized protein LOC111073646 isoform X5 [Drosophila obscura]|uniref:uncharacterized protein LOC111073646 isoform X5 n=1 Tax=Drosophila obscura TaxID=7282 RepID=UPI001BB232F2|nr:uncharacterized protein LOC111073646 isoform X5 [Drosophila obscura]
MFFQLYRTMDSTEMMHSDICGYMVFAFIPLSFGCGSPSSNSRLLRLSKNGNTSTDFWSVVDNILYYSCISLVCWRKSTLTMILFNFLANRTSKCSSVAVRVD